MTQPGTAHKCATGKGTFNSATTFPHVVTLQLINFVSLRFNWHAEIPALFQCACLMCDVNYALRYVVVVAVVG